MKKLFSGRRKAGPDQQFGTGLWRHNRDRFIRAVDRYYTTAVAIHKAHEVRAHGSATGAEEPAATSARDVNTIVDGTQSLNDLVPVVDEITTWLHSHHPVTGQVVPGHTRRSVGDTPELLTKASSKVAEAVLAASMARTEIPAGRPFTTSAEAAQRFISDAAELLDRARKNLS